MVSFDHLGKADEAVGVVQLCALSVKADGFAIVAAQADIKSAQIVESSRIPRVDEPLQHGKGVLRGIDLSRSGELILVAEIVGKRSNCRLASCDRPVRVGPEELIRRNCRVRWPTLVVGICGQTITFCRRLPPFGLGARLGFSIPKRALFLFAPKVSQSIAFNTVGLFSLLPLALNIGQSFALDALGLLPFLPLTLKICESFAFIPLDPLPLLLLALQAGYPLTLGEFCLLSRLSLALLCILLNLTPLHFADEVPPLGNHFRGHHT